MKRQVVKIVCLVISIMLLAGTLGACKKGGSGEAKANTSTASFKKSATASAAKLTGTAKTSSTANSTTNESTQKTAAVDNVNSQSLSSNDSGSGVAESAASGEIDSFVGAQSEKTINLNGRTFIMANNSPEPQENVDKVQTALYNSMRRAEQKYNMKIEYKYVPGGTGVIISEFVNAFAAGIKYCDAISTVTKQIIPFLVEQGMFTPLDDYLDFNSPALNYDNVKNVGLWKGKRYGIGSSPTNPNTLGVFFNKDIFATNGLNSLYDYVENNNWNWDTLLNIAQATTKDFNGDSVIDQWGIELYRGDYPGYTLLFSNGVSDIFEYKDGKVSFSFGDPKALKAMQFMSDLVNVYKVATPTMLSGYGFSKGIAAMALGPDCGNGIELIKTDVNYGFVPAPKGPDTDQYGLFVVGSGLWAIPSNTNAAESAPILADIITTWDTSKPDFLTDADFRLTYYQQRFRDQSDWDFLMKYLGQPRVSYYQSFGELNNKIWKEVYNKVVSLETTPAAAVNAIMSFGQDYFNQFNK